MHYFLRPASSGDLHPKRSPQPDFRDRGVSNRVTNAGQKKRLFLGRPACTVVSQFIIPTPTTEHGSTTHQNKKGKRLSTKREGALTSVWHIPRYKLAAPRNKLFFLCPFVQYKLAALRKRFIWPAFFQYNKRHFAKKRVGHACICHRMVTAQPVLKLYPPPKVSFSAAKKMKIPH